MRPRLVLGLLAVLVLAAGAAGAAFLLLRDDGGAQPDRRDREPASPAIAFTPGVQAGASLRDARLAAALGAPLARVEWTIDTPGAQLRPIVAAYARLGIRVQPLAGFAGRVPTRAEAVGLGDWAREVGPRSDLWDGLDRRLAVQAIEFGNETSFVYQGTHTQGGAYAERARDASRATNAAGVGLLIQADNANQSDRWIDQMYDAVPDLHRYAAAWVVHPYGPNWRRMLNFTINDTARRGAPRLPIAVTEYGIASDDGRCLDKNYGWDLCMTSDEAADALRGVVRDMRREYPRVTQLVLYNNHDLRPPGQSTDAENHFGAQRNDGSPKGAYTAAARALMRER